MLSLISLHSNNHGCEFDWGSIEIMDSISCISTREPLKAWYIGQLAISIHTDIYPIYNLYRRGQLIIVRKHPKKILNMNLWINDDDQIYQGYHSQKAIRKKMM